MQVCIASIWNLVDKISFFSDMISTTHATHGIPSATSCNSTAWEKISYLQKASSREPDAPSLDHKFYASFSFLICFFEHLQIEHCTTCKKVKMKRKNAQSGANLPSLLFPSCQLLHDILDMMLVAGLYLLLMVLHALIWPVSCLAGGGEE